jgi:hypothetical protein
VSGLVAGKYTLGSLAGYVSPMSVRSFYYHLQEKYHIFYFRFKYYAIPYILEIAVMLWWEHVPL